MAGAKNHEFHILPPSIWPLVGAFSALAMAAGGIAWMHGGHIGKPNGGGFVFFAGLAGVLFTMLSWWTDVVRESKAGDHTPVVSLHLRYGMILFIASEVMFFVGWFWAWFDFSLFPKVLSVAEGAVTVGAEGVVAQWPPKGLEVIDPFHLPLLNTLILLCSGTTVTTNLFMAIAMVSKRGCGGRSPSARCSPAFRPMNICTPRSALRG
jgi:cytochrome c oxidase subunit III